MTSLSSYKIDGYYAKFVFLSSKAFSIKNWHFNDNSCYSSISFKDSYTASIPSGDNSASIYPIYTKKKHANSRESSVKFSNKNISICIPNISLSIF